LGPRDRKCDLQVNRAIARGTYGKRNSFCKNTVDKEAG
jgi:hypothetical protein